MIGVDYIKSLPGDPECVEALTWLAQRATAYPSGLFVPPLKRSDRIEDGRRFIAASIRIGRVSRLKAGSRVSRVDTWDGESASSCDGTDSAIAEWFARTLLHTRTAGTYIVTTGKKRRVLDILLESIGKDLLRLGYSLQPCIGSSGISFIKAVRGKRSWHLLLYEDAFGVTFPSGEELATDAALSQLDRDTPARRIYSATSAAATFLLREFGVAFRPTSGMTAMACVRRFLPLDIEKWRPTPLLVAMERAGIGYRGGIAYASRYRGPSWRIDVNRQYTNALKAALPLRTAFGPYVSQDETPHGIFVCRLQLRYPIPFPLGIWCGPEVGFRYSTDTGDSAVCVLHSSEFPGLAAHGADITPHYGYVYNRTFTLATYVERIQAILDRSGKGSFLGGLTKPLGNYVYGKFAQKAARMELLFSDSRPDREWHPYFDDEGNQWEQVWERKHERHTASQHVDIAGTITGAARSQTALTWAYLSTLGYRVVRCHTDSLTLDSDPSGALSLSDGAIGAWRLEAQSEDAVIVGANAFIDRDGAHIAGVTDPTHDMVEQLYDGHVLYQTQDIMMPRQGWKREARQRTREYRAGNG